MTANFEKLENNEAILLMYVFDELSAEDRADVDRLLLTDRGMCAQLEELRASEQAVREALQAADREEPTPVPLAMAQRQADRLISQWSLRRLNESAEPPPTKRHHYLWLYPLGAAAAILIGGLVFWGFHDGGGVAYDPSNVAQNAAPDSQEFFPRPVLSDVQVAFLRSFDTGDELQDVEQQLQVIADRREDYSPVLSFDGLAR